MNAAFRHSQEEQPSRIVVVEKSSINCLRTVSCNWTFLRSGNYGRVQRFRSSLVEIRKDSEMHQALKFCFQVRQTHWVDSDIESPSLKTILFF